MRSIVIQIAEYRKLLTRELQHEVKTKDLPNTIEMDDNGREVAKDTHGRFVTL